MLKELITNRGKHNPLIYLEKLYFSGRFDDLVEESGEISNHTAMNELIKWGVIIENVRGFSGSCSSAQK